MSLSIRAATKEDAVLIADISRQTFYDSFAADNKQADMDKFLAEQFTRGKLILEVGASENDFFLAYYDDEVVGYAKLRESKPPAALGNFKALEIARLYSVIHMIGKGVGRLLMQASIDLAREKGNEVIWLAAWEKNHRAIEFYNKWGFEKFGDTHFLLGDDIQKDWLLRKFL